MQPWLDSKALLVLSIRVSWDITDAIYPCFCLFLITKFLALKLNPILVGFWSVSPCLVRPLPGTMINNMLQELEGPFLFCIEVNSQLRN
jgi:hypothetical protein